jgi:hypothetical protein
MNTYQRQQLRQAIHLEDKERFTYLWRKWVGYDVSPEKIYTFLQDYQRDITTWLTSMNFKRQKDNEIIDITSLLKNFLFLYPLSKHKPEP